MTFIRKRGRSMRWGRWNSRNESSLSSGSKMRGRGMDASSGLDLFTREMEQQFLHITAFFVCIVAGFGRVITCLLAPFYSFSDFCVSILGSGKRRKNSLRIFPESIMHRGRSRPSAFLILLLGFQLLVSAEDGVAFDVKEQTGAFRVESDLSKPEFSNEAEALQLKLKTLENLLEKKESSLQDKVKRIHVLENDLEVLQKSGVGEAEKRLEAAQIKEKELETHVERLQEIVRTLELQIQTLKSRMESSEATINELLAKNREATESIEQHQKRISFTEETLRLAEAALHRAESEAVKRTRQLTKAYQAWLPQWAATHIAQLQESITSKWVSHGEPMLDNLWEKASQSSAAAQDFAKPHLETIHEKWIPSLKKKWEKLAISFAPGIEILKTKVTDGFQHAKAYTSEHLVKFQASIRPYNKHVWAMSRPYVSKVYAYLQPHYKSLQKFVAPYTKRLHRIYKRYLRLAKHHHYQLQRHVKRTLSKNKYSARFAAHKELIWFLASGLLLLPALCILLLFSSQFGGRKKTSNTIRKTGNSHAGSSSKKHRRAKQVEKN